MGAENFLTFQVVDPNSRFTITSSRVTFTDMRAGDDATYVYLDKGAAFFDSSFVQPLTISITSSEQGGAINHLWALTNDIDDFRGLVGASKDFLTLQLSHPQSPNETQLHLREVDGGTEYNSAKYVITEGTVYYLKITRDESMGTHGTLYCYIYSNAARTTPLATRSITLHSSKKDFRYVFGVMSEDATVAITKKISGYSEDLGLGETGGGSGEGGGVAPQVTTGDLSSIGATTATGNGYIFSEGLASVTEHGHCWSTTVDPTTADSKTTLGAGSIGLFSSPITGLTPGIRYYHRAYATNSFGTSYGNGVSWVSGASYSMLSQGNFGIKGEQIHWVGESGREYYRDGTPV